MDNTTTVKKSKSKVIIIILIVIALLAGAGVGAFFLFIKKTTVNLNDYIKVEFEGYDGIGTAKIAYDGDRLKQDLGKTDDANMAVVIEKSGAVLEKDSMLTNGDSIKLSYFYDNKVAGESRIEFTCTDETVTVAGLTETEKIDPFADLKCKIEGTGPFATLNIKNKSKNELVKGLEFKADKKINISRGDKIKLWVDGYDKVKFITENKAELVPNQQEIDVEGISQYVVNLDNVPDSVVEALDDMALNKGVKRYLKSTSLRPYVKATDIQRLGIYLLVKKNLGSYKTGFVNKCYVVYEMNIKCKKKNKKKKPYFKEMKFYMPVEINDVFVSKKEKVRCFRYVTALVDQYFIKGRSKVLFNGLSPLTGYTSLKKLKKEVVKSLKKEYDCLTYGDLK